MTYYAIISPLKLKNYKFKRSLLNFRTCKKVEIYNLRWYSIKTLSYNFGIYRENGFVLSVIMREYIKKKENSQKYKYND